MVTPFRGPLFPVEYGKTMHCSGSIFDIEEQRAAAKTRSFRIGNPFDCLQFRWILPKKVDITCKVILHALYKIICSRIASIR